MLTSTTHSLDGKPIKEYIGIVNGEAILLANSFKHFYPGILHIVDGRTSGYERSLRKARKIALEEAVENAEDLKADAVVGIDFDYETVGETSSMLMVTVSGTAVKL